MDYLSPVADPSFRDVSVLGVDEPVLGGIDGVDNRPHRELAERDDYLKVRADKSDALIAILKGQVDGLNLNSSSAVRTAVLLNWLYGDASPSFELWGAGFTWRDIRPIAVTAATAGDDTVDVVSTEGLIQGRTYVIVNPQSMQLETIKVSVILNATRFRTELNLQNSLNTQSGAVVARTAAQVLDGYAIFGNGDHYYSRVIDELRVQAGGQLVLRRSADGVGTFAVSYRVFGSQAWAAAPLANTTARAANTRDETYTIGVGGSIELRVIYTAPTGNLLATERVDHMALLPPSRADAASAVGRPTNVSPADQAANVGQTPTLTGSPFLSLYGLSQAGAEFRVSRNPSMSDLVFNSSTDFLAAWLAVSGQSTSFADVVATGPKTFTLVANGVSIRTTDGGLTFTTGTVTGDLRRVAADSGLLVAVGASGAIRTSADNGLTYTTRTPANSYAGTFAGVVVRGSLVTAVGDAGTIQRSVNGGAIFNAVTQAASYAGTFADLAGDASGNQIAVGSTGEIQTSSNDGQTWTHRNSPGGYAAGYQAVAMDDLGNAVAVGANGAIHTSADYGATWTARAAAGAYAGTFYGVAIRGKRVVVVGASGEIQTSPDLGATWVHRATGGNATAQISAVALDANSYGLAVGAAGLVQRTNKVDSAATTYTVPAGTDFLQMNTVYWWQVRYQDTAGAFSAWSVPTAFAVGTVTNYVNAPSNLSPASGDTAVSLQPTLQSSAFSYVGAADTHSRSQWQVATSASFASVFYDSGEVTDLTAHTVAANGILSPQITYFWRVRHKGTNDGYGGWSEPTSFVAQTRPNKPSITSPVDGSTGTSTSPTITTSAFSMPGGGTHAASQYQVSTLSSFASVLHDSGDTSALTSYTLPAGTLAFNTQYYARARHKESGGTYSAWSNVVGFKTLATSQVSDVFGPVTFAGTGANRSVTLASDLTGGGMLLTAGALNETGGSPSPTRSLALFDTVRGIGAIGSASKARLIGGGSSSPIETSPVDMVGSLTATGFTAGTALSGSGKPYVVYPFKVAPKFFAMARIVHQSGTDDLIDLSSLGTVGMIWAFGLNVAAEFSWHRSSAPYSQPPFQANQRSSAIGNISVSGTTATLAAAQPSGIYMLYAFAHDDSLTGIIQCTRFTMPNFGDAVVDTGWANGVQFIYVLPISNPATAQIFPCQIVDTVRSPGFTGTERQLRVPGYEQAGDFVTMSGSKLTFKGVSENGGQDPVLAMFVRAPA